MSVAAGSRLGPYEILSPLGAGGMGEVYRARDTRLGREVAVKVLPERYAADPDLRGRFEREARAAAAINHPNIVAIYDVGEAGGVVYLVTELIAGVTLRDWLASNRPSWKKAAEIGAQIADGLGAAHGRGIVHRDLKPENVILSPDGRIKVLDFGLARCEEPAGLGPESAGPTLAAATQPGTILGTVGYMSPEQVRGRPCDARTDVFALGCVAFEIATGERAFSGPSPADTMSRILQEEIRARIEGHGDFPESFARVLERCLEKDADGRFQSMRDLAFAWRLTTGEKHRTARVGYPLHGSAPEAPPRTSVAVLPFVNRSPDVDNEYFCDGMTEELIGALSSVPGLRVASRTSVFALKGRFQDVRELGQELSAAAILEGSVRRSGDRLRVTVELTNVSDGYHLWSDSFDGDLRDVFAFQDEIARRIVDALRSPLGLSAPTPLPRRPDTQDLHAYQLYWKGRHLWGKRTPEDRMKAIALLEEALRVDPGYARAWAGLADCFLERGGIGLPARRVMERARAAALRAIAIDDSLADAHTSLGRVLLYFDRDWAAAESEFRRSIALDPRYAEGHHSYSHFLLPAGRVAESYSESALARDLEPLDLGIRTHLGWHFLYSGDFAAAVEQCRFAIEMDSTFFYAHFYLGMAYEQLGDNDAALRAFDESVRLSPESGEAAAGRIHLLAATGRRDEAKQALKMLEGRMASSISYETAVAKVGFGDPDAALDLLEKSCRDREERIVDLDIDPRFRGIRDLPRYGRLLREIGAPQ